MADRAQIKRTLIENKELYNKWMEDSEQSHLDFYEWYAEVYLTLAGARLAAEPPHGGPCYEEGVLEGLEFAAKLTDRFEMAGLDLKPLAQEIRGLKSRVFEQENVTLDRETQAIYGPACEVIEPFGVARVPDHAPVCGNCGGATKEAVDRHFYCSNGECSNCMPTSDASATPAPSEARTITLPESVQVQRVLTVIAIWKVERDAKCDLCKKCFDLGAHGCHFDDDIVDGESESYSLGNCKAWPLSRRIKQLEEAMRP